MALNRTINSLQLEVELDKILEEYADDVHGVVEKTIHAEALKAKNVVKAHAPVQAIPTGGAYKRAISLKKETSKLGTVKDVIYVKSPEHTIAHLLEFGHAKVNGKGRTRKFPHFYEGEKYLKQNLPDAIESAIGKIK